MILESHVGAKNDDKVFCNEYRDASLFSENWERGIKVDARAIKIFHESQINRKVKGTVSDPSGALYDYKDLLKVQLLHTDFANIDALNVFQEVGNSEGKVYPARTVSGIIFSIRRHLEENMGSKLVACVRQSLWDWVGSFSHPDSIPQRAYLLASELAVSLINYDDKLN